MNRALPLLSTAMILSSLAFAAAAPTEEETGETVVIGPTTREQIENAVPEWVHAEVEAAPDAAVSRELASVPEGAEVTVFLGTWCSDSRREVPRLWKALAMAGGDVPFGVRYVGVDRDKKEPADAVAESEVLYLPTFIVHRDGREVGRIVETSPHGIERDLVDLLTGKARGVLTTREDLAPEGTARPPR
jgi:thiol-disulfide isomerase/thioredoxin